MSPFFAKEMPVWAKKSEKLRPALHETWLNPVAVVTPIQDKKVWQGVRMEVVPDGLDDFKKRYHWTRSWTFDFGRHVVGTIEIDWKAFGINDAPVRIDYKFAETPYELTTDFRTYKGHLDRSWLQEGEVIHERFQNKIRIPRRFAFRYVTLSLGSPNYDVKINSIRALAISSADDAAYTPISEKDGFTKEECRIDKCAAWTLHECMQEFFEDGPKRDRRLWLGDLRIQALVNGVTYRNFKLVERCIYLLAATCTDEGEIPGASYDFPEGPKIGNTVPTYALLLGPLLLEHYNFYQRKAFCKEFLPLALHQIDLFRKFIDKDGKIKDSVKRWFFIDHDAELFTKTPAIGLYAFTLRKVAELAEILGTPHPELIKEADSLCAKLHKRCFDASRNLYRSDDEKRQFAWATQIWFILAGVPSKGLANKVWKAMLKADDALRPHTPYLWTSALEAGVLLGQTKDVKKIIHDYWGKMLQRDGDTFPEVFVESDPLFSSYGDPIMNSDCHAWSCGAGYFIRKMK